MELATVEELIAGTLERMKEPDYIERVKANIAADDRRRTAQKPQRSADARRYEQRNPGKIAARKAVMWAVKRGDLRRGPCAQRDRKCFGRVEAHHHAGYAWKNRYDVTWLCRYHHIMADHPAE